MRKYIIDLTDDLIKKHGIDRVLEEKFLNTHSSFSFLTHLVLLLLRHEVAHMSAKTLGKIMGELEPGDVSTEMEGDLRHINFDGDSTRLLRHIDALSLAYVIRDRLDPSSDSRIPPYRCSTPPDDSANSSNDVKKQKRRRGSFSQSGAAVMQDRARMSPLQGRYRHSS